MGKWIVAVGWGKQGEIVVIDSSNFKFKQFKLFGKDVWIFFLEIVGNQLWMGWSGGVRVADMDEQGNVKLLPNKYLEGKTVSQLHNLS